MIYAWLSVHGKHNILNPLCKVSKAICHIADFFYVFQSTPSKPSDPRL